MSDKNKITEPIRKTAPVLLAGSFLEVINRQKTIMATGRSFQMLETVAKTLKTDLNLLIIVTFDGIFEIARKALHRCSDRILHFQLEDEKITVKFSRVQLTIRKWVEHEVSIVNDHNESLNGILYFADFSTAEKAAFHTQKLTDILRATSEDCIICYTLSPNGQSRRINETSLPKIFFNATGRTISLVDLTLPNMSVEEAITEFVEQIIFALKQ